MHKDSAHFAGGITVTIAGGVALPLKAVYPEILGKGNGSAGVNTGPKILILHRQVSGLGRAEISLNRRAQGGIRRDRTPIPEIAPRPPMAYCQSAGIATTNLCPSICLVP